MANIRILPGWQGKEQDTTPERVYANRRTFIKKFAFGTVGLASTGVPGLSCAGNTRRDGTTTGPQPVGPLDTIPDNAPRIGYPAPQNPDFAVPERNLSDRFIASSYNNYYEFSAAARKIWHLTGDYKPFPMTLKVTGLVERPFTIDIESLITSMELEERIYRFRCVEAWALTIPWTGFPLRKLIDRCKPLSSASYVRFISAGRKDEMPGITSLSYYQWPYYEGLRIGEAVNDLAFVATGMYGEPLPKQNGSPIRLALPWKYGYKGAKAIVQIDFTDRQPSTFWNDLQPLEYGFLSNVNPNIPHPRWNQSSERLLSTNDRVPTQLFNGYDEWVSDLYPDEPRTPTRSIVR